MQSNKKVEKEETCHPLKSWWVAAPPPGVTYTNRPTAVSHASLLGPLEAFAGRPSATTSFLCTPVMRPFI